jgi:small subunit ribosomal protein S13
MAEKKLVRFMEAVLDGNLASERALRNIKGIGHSFSKVVCYTAGIDPKKKLGDLSPDELASLEKHIRNPEMPAWMINRRKDPETGKNIHLVGNTLDFSRREDINVMKRMRSYKGIRHEQGQPVRGQRTRSTFRTKKTVGVMKKAAKQAAKPKAESGEKKK